MGADSPIAVLAATYADGRLARGEITPRTHSNIRSRLSGLVSVAGDIPVAGLDWPVIDRWQRSIGNRAASTRRSCLSTIRVFCEWLVIDGHIQADPTGRSAAVHEPRRVPRAQPSEAIARLLAIAPDARALLVVWLMVGIGLRRCEVARLEIHDWDPVAETVHVRGKANHERLLPLPDTVSAALHAHVAVAGWQAGPLIRSGTKAITPEQVSALVAKMMRAAGLKRGPWDGVSAHALRHTCASDVLDRCHDIRTVQELLGHASVATTQIYTRRADLDKLRTAMGGRTYGQTN